MSEDTPKQVTIEEKPEEGFSCPECPKRFPTKQGLKGHIRFSHPFAAGARLQEGVSPKEGERTMPTPKEEVKEALREALKETQDRAREFNVSEQLSVAQKEAETWKAKVTQLEAEVAEPRDITELEWDEFAKHCQTCPRHKAQLDAYLTQVQQGILSKLTKDEVKPLAEKHGLWPPKPIIIERGKR